MEKTELVKPKLNTDNQYVVPPMLLRTLKAGGFLRANGSFLAKVGFSEAELAEKPFLYWIDPNDVRVATATIEGKQSSCRIAHRTKDGEHLPLQIRVVENGGESLVLARPLEDAEVINDPEDSEDEATVRGTLHTIARIVEEQNSGYKCSILLVADGHFVRGAGPSLPEEYNTAIDGYAIGPTVGSCGTAIYWNVPVIAEDIQADPLWVPFAELAKKAGVAACWSYPFSGRTGNVLGALALYSPVPRMPTKEQLGSLKAAARMTGLAVERGRAEEALWESEEKYRELFEKGSDLLCIHDLEGNLIQTNLSFKNACGYSLYGLDNVNIRDLVPERYRHQVKDYLKSIIEKGKDEGFMRIVTKDGGEITIEYNNILICDETGPTWVQGSGKDITERLKNERALKESEEKYRAILDNIDDGYYEVDLAGNFTFFNNSLCRILGYSPSEMMGKNNRAYMEPEIAREVFKTFNRIFTTRAPCHVFDWELIKKNGTKAYIDSSVSLICDEKGMPTGFRGIVRDITERKRMEEALLRVQKLESIGVLAGGIAHDFNNILTMILGNVSLAKMQAKPGDKIFDFLNEAETASARAQTLTKQLLTFAKGGVPVKETVSIKNILRESSLFVLRDSKSSCEFSIAEDLWPTEVDIGQISQVINNIVINANQAMPEGGIIQVVAENLIIDNGQGFPLKPGRYIRISIEDQGVGIAEKHLSKIFDPYFKIRNDGIGLGLPTAYSIIKKHDGHIAVESQLGMGTKLTIYLPASEQEIPEKEKLTLIKGQGRILIMDDESSIRKLMGRMLVKLGYESEVATDGAEAIQMYKEAQESEKPYDAVILDLTNPFGMGGKEAIIKLLEIDPEVKAIVSSGYSDDPVMANFQEYGFKGMMPKPFEFRSLGKVLQEVLKDEKE